MMRKFAQLIPVLALTLIWSLAVGSPAMAQEVIKLDQPDVSQGTTVLQAIKDRKSERVFGSGDLSHQQLSEVIWAASGVNRELGEGKVGRTSPTSHDDQALDTYVFLKSGVYKYDHLKHELHKLIDGDQRAKAGVQSYVGTAPVNLILVADLSKLSGDTEQYKRMSMNMDAGHASENVYLYGASVGLHVICRSTIERDELRALLKLGDQYEPVLGITVGLPQ